MNNNKTFEEECRAIAIEVSETLIEKHKEYGVDNILIFKEQGLVVRVWDKVSRLKNIVWKGQSPSILEDTWKDMAGYAMIGMMLQRGTFTVPLEGQVKQEQR